METKNLLIGINIAEKIRFLYGPGCQLMNIPQSLDLG
jgi:hypothetical protein